MTKAGTDSRNATSPRSIRDAQRRTEMLALRVNGLTLEQIGEVMGIEKSTVSRVIGNALATLVREPAQELLALELERCDVLLAQAMQTARAFHPVIYAGRVVTGPLLDTSGMPIRDACTGDVIFQAIEDKAPKLAAIATAIRVMERRAKLLGIDGSVAPQLERRTSLPQDLSKLSQEELEVLDRLITKISTVTSQSTDSGART